MKPAGTISFIAAGFAVIAASYGLARFAYGLFLPAITADLGLSRTEAGLISAGAFAAYCLAITVAALASNKLGARRIVLIAGLVATTGMAGIAWSDGVGQLAAAVFLAGVSTGLVSPPLALAVSQSISGARQGAANTLINSGTSAGVILSGPVAIGFAEAWREAYAVFAVMALGVTVWLGYAMPVVASFAARREERAGPIARVPGALRPVLLAAFLMGMTSTAFWTFGGVLLQALAGWGEEAIARVWIVIGIAGIAGAAAGPLIRRFGLNPVHRLSLAVLTLSLLLLIFSATSGAVPLVAAALFGGAYIMLTGVILVWGVEMVPSSPALGLGAGFLAIAAGQVAGAPLFGALYDWKGGEVALLAFSGLACMAMCVHARPARLP